METIRILLVDDHVVVRKGLVHVLDNHDAIEVVGEAENGEEALVLARKLTPDVILMDIKMNGLGGIKTTELIAKAHPDIRIIGLSTYADRSYIDDMIDAGASGYLQKHITIEDLTTSIRLVHDGDILPYPMQLDHSAIDHADGEPEPANNKPKLSKQQKRVLALLSKGFTNPEIADKLGVSVPTARYHVSTILQKLDVSNRSEAAATAIRDNLVNARDF